LIKGGEATAWSSGDETTLHGGQPAHDGPRYTDIGRASGADSCPAFDTRPKTVDDIINHTVGRCSMFGIETKAVMRSAGCEGRAEEVEWGLSKSDLVMGRHVPGHTVQRGHCITTLGSTGPPCGDAGTRPGMTCPTPSSLQ